MGGRFTPHTTNLRLINFNIESILAHVYGINEYQVVGAPKWPFPTLFMIEAKSDSDADAKLAGMLSAMFGRPVTDKTGLTGKYDFVMQYKDRWDSDRKDNDTDPTPPLDHALQDELGLKVEAAKGPVKVLVIDHIEKPSEN